LEAQGFQTSKNFRFSKSWQDFSNPWVWGLYLIQVAVETWP